MPEEDHRGWIVRNGRWLRLGAYILLTFAVIYASARTFQLADQNRDTIQRIEQEAKAREAESRERRDQTCRSDEQEHLSQVVALKNTYLYLLNLTHEERQTTFNRFIIAQVSQTEEKAKIDVAPDFCDEPGEKAERLYAQTNGKQGSPPVGLPEPDPKVPARPEQVDQMILDLANQKPVLVKPKSK